MTEADNVDVIDDDVIIVNEVEEEEDNNEEVTETEWTDEVTEDEEVKRLKDQLAKAEKAIVDLKRNSKKSKETTATEFLTKKDLDVIRFIDSNPDLAWYEDDLKGYMDKWLTLDDAKLLLKSKDPVLQNREKVQQISVTWGDSWNSKTTYSTQDLEKLSRSEYNKVMNLIDSWKAIRKG